MATIDADTRRKANLRVLQRMDRNVVDVAITVTHVVLYEYNTITKQSSWEKKNVEGTLFVTKRSDAPRFKLIVLNRNSTENLEIPITAVLQMQVKDPYLILRDSPESTEFLGIWFHDGNERGQIASYLEQVVNSLVKIEEMESNGKMNINQSTGTDKDDHTTRQEAGAALLAALTMGNAKGGENHVTTGLDITPSKPVPTVEQQATHISNPPQNIVLDKKSLQLSLLSLLQDDRFIDLIHAQYLKVVQKRAEREQQEKKK
jgi:mRNA-decapping enzyme 1B